MNMNNIWRFQQTLTQRLSRWAAASFLLGLPLLLLRPFWRGVGGQFVGWAVINAGIALFGGLFTDRRKQKLADPYAPEVEAKERRNLRRILWINTALDVLYVFGGERLTHNPRAYTRGMGWGIIVQGLFLFFFDLLHARALHEPASIRLVKQVDSDSVRHSESNLQQVRGRHG